MVAFRKSYSVLAILAGLLLGSSAASAQIPGQVNCAAASGVPPIVRAEGATELVGDIVLTCSGGSPAAPFLANFQVFLNTNITSRLLSVDTSEALLMIDEPGALTNAMVPALAPSPADNGNSAYNVFRANTTPQASAVVWPGILITPPGTTGQRIIRITNLRANASAIGASSTLVPNQITAFISVSPSNTISINNPQQTVAYVQQGMTFGVSSCAGSGVPSFQQCVSSGGAFNVRFTENFQTAFKERIIPGQETSSPGAVFNSESGFVRSGFTGGGNSIGVATSGTRLAARFRDLPAGTRLFASVQNIFPTGATPSARLIQAGPNGEGSSVSGGGFVVGTSSIVCAGGSALAPEDSPGFNAAEIPITGGIGTAVWEVIDANQSTLETLSFNISASYTADPANSLPAIGTARASGTFAPFYTGINDLSNPGGRASASLPIPRFVENTDLVNAFVIQACETNLLFPFVTAQAGFDTGIAISNTSQDHFASPANRRQAGTCTINYFGNVTGGGNAPNPQTTNAVIPAGGQLTFVVSSGGNFGIAGTPGFQGYVFARCLFRYAHGFAFVTDGPIGQANVAEGYLALVVDGGTVNQPRGVVFGENLGH